MKYRDEIDGLRAFSILSVIIYHCKFYVNDTFLLSGGFLGVDIFFVISGFVMIHTQIQNPKKIYEFYFSRLNRIVPIYWLISLFIVLIYFLRLKINLTQ